MEYSIGPMVLIMKDNGISIKLMDREPSGMLKVTFIGANSKMIWPTAMESTPILTEVNIRENSEMMFKKATVRKSGLTEQNMLVPTKMV